MEGERESNQAVSQREDESKKGSRRDLCSSIDLNKNTVEEIVFARHLDIGISKKHWKEM